MVEAGATGVDELTSSQWVAWLVGATGVADVVVTSCQWVAWLVGATGVADVVVTSAQVTAAGVVVSGAGGAGAGCHP